MSFNAEPRAPRPKLLITVHGIRTFGQWQERLGALARGADPALQVAHFKYGYFSVLAFALPLLRWLAVRTFRRSILAAAARHPDHELMIVGHSNGTYLIGHALRQSTQALRGRIGTVVLAGSVLRSDFDWEPVISESGIERVINDCGVDDGILVLSQLGVLFTGMAGRIGFHGMTGSKLHNRYFPGGHSHYFEREGQPDDSFMARYWVPALIFGEVEAADFRRRTGPLGGATLWLLQNADFIKLTTYSAAFAAAFFILYLAPRAQADAQRAQRIGVFAANALSEEILPDRALLDLAVELDSKPQGPLKDHWQTLRYYLPRMLNLRALTEPRGVYTIIRRELEMWVHVKDRFIRANMSPEDWIFLAKNDSIISISATGNLAYFAPQEYSNPLKIIDIGRSPWIGYPPDASDIDGRQVTLTSVKITSAHFVPSDDSTVLNLIVRLRGVDDAAAKTLGETENDFIFGLIHLNLNTQEARAYLIPGTSEPVLDKSCGQLLYAGHNESTFVLDRHDPEQYDSPKLRAMKKRWTQVLERYMDTIQVPVLVLAATAKHPPRLTRISLREARAQAWNRASLFEAAADCTGVAHNDKYANFAFMGGSPRIPFPYMREEVESWTKALKSPIVPPVGQSFKPLDAAAARALKLASTSSDRTTAERNEAAEWLKTERLLFESYATQRDGAKVYLQQTASQNFGISAWRLSKVGPNGRDLESIASVVSNYNKPFIASNTGRFLVSPAEREVSNASALVLDVNTMSGIELEATPDQYIVAAAFNSEDDELALLGASGTLMRIRLPDGRLLGSSVVRSSTFREPGHTFISDVAPAVSMSYLGKYLILQMQNGSIVAIEPDTTEVRWWSTPLPGKSGSEPLRFYISRALDVIAVSRSGTLRLLSAQTGLWLSGPISGDKLIQLAPGDCSLRPENDNDSQEDGPEKIDDVTFLDGGGVAVRIRDCWFQRAPPFDATQVRSSARDIGVLSDSTLRIERLRLDSLRQ
ncbi:MAG: hypothetical protein ACN6OP_11385 [Pseudomonadales bacterium]